MSPLILPPPDETTEEVVTLSRQFRKITTVHYEPVEPPAEPAAEPTADAPADEPAPAVTPILAERFDAPDRLIDERAADADDDRLVWVRANSDGPQQTGANIPGAASRILAPDAGGPALELALDPLVYPHSYGCRAVLTEDKQWIALRPYAGQVIVGRLVFEWPDGLPDLGPDGTWCSHVFQIKADPNVSAIVQFNLDAGHVPWLKHLPTNTVYRAAAPLRPAFRHTATFRWGMDAEPSQGFFELALDGAPIGRLAGQMAHPAGYGHFHLLFYTDQLRRPARLLIHACDLGVES